jgi:hypothetical protein
VQRDFAARAIAALDQDAYRETAGDPVPLAETSWALSRLTPEAMNQLSTFLTDLSRRSPLAGPAWSAHRIVIEALEADIRRELAKYE